jgi:general stress protein 26
VPPAELDGPLARELLAAPLVATLATFEPGGGVYLNAMWFAWHDGALLLGTGATTRKVVNVERDPRASVLIHDSRVGFDVCGLRVSGRVDVVRGTAGAELVRVVHGRYLTDEAWSIPSVREFLEANDVALRLVPDQASVWDERGQAANRDLLARGGYRPLPPTSPR